MDAAAYDGLWAAGWDDTRLYGPMARHGRRLMKAMSADLDPKTILDVGCGEGSLLKALMEAHPGASGTGLEVSEQAITLARSVVPDAAFESCDIATTALNETFDLVVSADVVEHIEDAGAAIANLAAHDGARRAAHHFHIAGPHARLRTACGACAELRPWRIGRKMRAAGLKVERVMAWGWPFYSPLYRNLLDVLDNSGTMGRFGPVRKLICHGLYAMFMLNRSAKGDYLFVRAVKER